MKSIEFSKEEKAEIVGRIRAYFDRELDQAIGAMPAEFLLDFFASEIGHHFYNQGLRDAHSTILRRLEDAAEDIYLLEQQAKDGKETKG